MSKRWLPPIAWMVTIFLVSNQPSTDLPNFGLLDLLVKKVGHFTAYAILAWLWQRAWKPGTASWPWALGITILFAISDEFHQTFISGRFGSLADVLIDTSGALTALLIAHYQSTLTRHSPRPSFTTRPARGEVQSAQTVPIDEPIPPAA